MCVFTVPVTWWRHAFLLFSSRLEPSPTSQLLTQLVDYLGGGAEQKMECKPTGKRPNVEQSFGQPWHPPSVHSCRCQGSSLSGLSFSAVCLLYSSAMLLLMYSWLSSVRCSSNHVVDFTVLTHPNERAGLQNILGKKRCNYKQRRSSLKSKRTRTQGANSFIRTPL